MAYLLRGRIYKEGGTRGVLVNGAVLKATKSTSTSTLYWYVSESASAPSVPHLKDGTGSVDFGSKSTPDINVGSATTFDVTGLDAGTTYYSYFIQNNSVTGDSNLLESDSWQTASAGVTVIPMGMHLLDRQYAAIAAHRLGGVLQ